MYGCQLPSDERIPQPDGLTVCLDCAEQQQDTLNHLTAYDRLEMEVVQ
jgi:hypothetical protein